MERGDDQQDRVGAGGRGLVDLVRVDDEVLAQHRQLAWPRGPRAGRRASRRSGTARSGPTAPRRRRARRRARPPHADALADRARRRRAALVLGDHARCRGASAPRRTGGPRRGRRAPPRARGSGTARGGAGRRPRGSSSTMAPRTVMPAPAPGQRHEPLERGGGAAVVDRRLGRAHARLERVGAAGDVDRRAGVEHGEVALRAGLAGEDPPRDLGVVRPACRRATSSARRARSPTSSGESS